MYSLANEGTAQARIGINNAAPSGSYAAATYVAPLVTSAATANQRVTVEFGAGTIIRPQIELGAASSGFESRPVEIDEAVCKGFFQEGEDSEVIGGVTPSSWYIRVMFSVKMRGSPAVVRTGNGPITSGTAGSTTNFPTQNGFYFYNTTNAVGGSWTASVEP